MTAGEAEAEEQTVQVEQQQPDNTYVPNKVTPQMGPVVAPPHAAAPCDFDLVNMAEAEEHSIALDRRQISAAEADAMGGRRRHHAADYEAGKIAVETPMNSHAGAAGAAEAEEMAWALDRQQSGQPAKDPEPRRRLPSETAPTEPEDPKEALQRRCSHDVVGGAEAEEIAYQLDRQASGQAGQAPTVLGA